MPSSYASKRHRFAPQSLNLVTLDHPRYTRKVTAAIAIIHSGTHTRTPLVCVLKRTVGAQWGQCHMLVPCCCDERAAADTTMITQEQLDLVSLKHTSAGLFEYKVYKMGLIAGWVIHRSQMGRGSKHTCSK